MWAESPSSGRLPYQPGLSAPHKPVPGCRSWADRGTQTGFSPPPRAACLGRRNMEASEQCLLSGPWCWAGIDWGACTPETCRNKNMLQSLCTKPLEIVQTHPAKPYLACHQFSDNWTDSLETSCDTTFHFSYQDFLLPLLGFYKHVLVLPEYSTEQHCVVSNIYVSISHITTRGLAVKGGSRLPKVCSRFAKQEKNQKLKDSNSSSK